MTFAIDGHHYKSGTRWPWPFQDQIFETLFSLKWAVLARICTGYFLEFDTCQWRARESCTPWPWPNFSTSNIWNVNISDTVRACERRHCECCTQWPWPTFQGKQFEMWISQKQWFLANTIEMTLNIMCFNNILVFCNENDHEAVPADLPSLVWHPPSSCSCYQ